jgi:hypothetical protein
MDKHERSITEEAAGGGGKKLIQNNFMNIFNKPESNTFKNFIPEAIFIAALTAVSYLGVFMYKLGGFSFYNIDSLFIDIDLRDILSINSVALIVVLGIIYYLAYLAMNRKDNQKRFNWLFPLLLITLFVFPILIILLDKFSFISAITFMAGIILGIFFESKTKNKKDPLDYLKDKFGIFLILFLLFIVLYCLYCYAIGLHDTKSKIYYSTIDLNQKSLIIVSSYDKSLLCLPFKKESKTFSKDLLLLTQESISGNGTLIKNEKIGPLKSEN